MPNAPAEITNPACPCWSGYHFMHRPTCGCETCDPPEVYGCEHGFMHGECDRAGCNHSATSTTALHLLGCRTCGMLRQDCTLAQSNGGQQCCRWCRHHGDGSQQLPPNDGGVS